MTTVTEGAKDVYIIYAVNLNQTSLTYISDSFFTFGQKDWLCVKCFQDFGLDCHRTPGLIEQRTEADQAEAVNRGDLQEKSFCFVFRANQNIL